MRGTETKHTAVLFAAALVLAALAAGPAAPASAQTCDIPTGGEYTLPGDCTLASTIEVEGSLIIHGDGHTIDADGHQAFDVWHDETLALDNLALVNGRGIENRGTLTITNGAFSGNSTHTGGGVIENDGTVTVIDSTFSGNSASTFGGAILNYGTAAVINSTFSGNSAGMDGGAIDNWGTVTVSNSSFFGNSASGFGGAIDNWGGSLTVGECSAFQKNTAGASGDGIGNYDIGTVNVTGSVIYNEVYHGVGVHAAASTTAESNWWGSANGPRALAVNLAVDAWWIGNPCEVTVPFGTVDPAPVSGEVRFFTGFGYELPLQPEGRPVGTLEATAGEQTWGQVRVFCGGRVRAWLFDLEGNAVGLIPSQHENGDGVFAPYDEDYSVRGVECGYLETSPSMYTGRYADMVAE